MTRWRGGDFTLAEKEGIWFSCSKDETGVAGLCFVSDASSLLPLPTTTPNDSFRVGVGVSGDLKPLRPIAPGVEMRRGFKDSLGNPLAAFVAPSFAGDGGLVGSGTGVALGERACKSFVETGTGAGPLIFDDERGGFFVVVVGGDFEGIGFVVVIEELRCRTTDDKICRQRRRHEAQGNDQGARVPATANFSFSFSPYFLVVKM